MILDPVLVAAEAVARAEKRRMPVGDACQFVEPSAGKPTQAIEMRLEGAEILTPQIERQQIAQASIDCIKILSRTIGRKVGCATVGSPREGLIAGKRVHGRFSRSSRFRAEYRVPANGSTPEFRESGHRGRKIVPRHPSRPIKDSTPSGLEACPDLIRMRGILILISLDPARTTPFGCARDQEMPLTSTEPSKLSVGHRESVAVRFRD